MESGGSKRVSTFLESSDTRCGARIVEAVSAMGQMLAISRIFSTRSPPRTVSGGEFDWGGTSVKR
jgi:hypothetical protein